MFIDSTGKRFDPKKIVHIDPGVDFVRGVPPETFLRHDVWVDGVTEPFTIDSQTLDSVLERRGTVVEAQSGFYVVDLSENSTKPEIIPILAWLIPENICNCPIPITLRGLNNGLSTEKIYAILNPNGSVTDIEETFNSVEDFALDQLKWRQDA